MKTFKTIILIVVVSCLLGCEQLHLDNYSLGDWRNNSFGDYLNGMHRDNLIGTLRDRSAKTTNLATTNSGLGEVTTPQIIQELHPELKQYNPLVTITAPQAETTFNQTDVALKLAVADLPIFQDERLHLGNHLNLIIDNEPLQPIFSVDEPIIIKNLAPGTHTVRVVAVSPWGESFKNEGAYAQTTFNILTQTNANRPNNDLPLLTYNSPTGNYGAQPILLDFYLNQPNGAIAEQIDDQKLLVKATINGTSLIIEDWEPHYLTGFESGDNWIQLELIDELGNTVENTFNNTVRVFTYNPQQEDSLGKLVTNKISLRDAQSIVQQNYYIQPADSSSSAVPAPSIETNSEATPSGEPKDKAEEITKRTEPKKETLVEDKTTEKVIEQQKEEPSTLETKSSIDPIPEPDKQDSQPIKTLPPANSGLALKPESKAIDQVKTPTEVNPKEEIDSFPPKITEKQTLKTPKTAEAESIIITAVENPESSTEIVTIKTPEPESVIIDDQEIVLTIPKTQPTNESNSFTAEQKEAPKWWKKILVGLRQTLESLARLLPSEV